MSTVRQTGSSRRLSLLQAALDLFSTQGYAGTTTRAIAERSGVTEAILYRHFATKQDLLRAVVEQYSPRPLFAPPPVSVQILPIRAALELLVTLYLDTFWANRAFMLMVFTTPRREQAALAEIHAEFHDQGVGLCRLLQERSDRHELRPDIATVATDVIAAATGGFLQRVLDDEPADWEQARAAFVTNLLDTVLHGILLPSHTAGPGASASAHDDRVQEAI